MKKRLTTITIAALIILSVFSFVYLNAENPHFTLFEFTSNFGEFNVSSSSLPDVEAVKNTLIFMKEVIFFDL